MVTNDIIKYFLILLHSLHDAEISTAAKSITGVQSRCDSQPPSEESTQKPFFIFFRWDQNRRQTHSQRWQINRRSTNFKLKGFLKKVRYPSGQAGGWSIKVDKMRYGAKEWKSKASWMKSCTQTRSRIHVHTHTQTHRFSLPSKDWWNRNNHNQTYLRAAGCLVVLFAE